MIGVAAPCLLLGVAAGLLAADVGSFVKGWTTAPALLDRHDDLFLNVWKRLVMRIREALQKEDQSLWEEICYALASHLRAGATAAQAVRAVAAEGDAFTNRTLARVTRAYDAGTGLMEALSAESLRHPELDQVTSALDMGSSAGGDIPALLCHLAETMRRRRLSRGELRSKLTEARATAVLLSLLPWGVAAFTLSQDSVSAAAMLRDPRGQALLAAAGLLWGTGNVAAILLLRSLEPPKATRHAKPGRSGRQLS